MNRRDFMKGVAALTAVVAVPIQARAAEAVIKTMPHNLAPSPCEMCIEVWDGKNWNRIASLQSIAVQQEFVDMRLIGDPLPRRSNEATATHIDFSGLVEEEYQMLWLENKSSRYRVCANGLGVFEFDGLFSWLEHEVVHDYAVRSNGSIDVCGPVTYTEMS